MMIRVCVVKIKSRKKMSLLIKHLYRNIGSFKTNTVKNIDNNTNNRMIILWEMVEYL